MTDKVLVLNGTSGSVDTIESFYTSPGTGLGTRINAFTATNDTESSKSYKAYIYDASGDPVQTIIPLTEIARDRADYGSSAINQVIPAGGTLRMESSAIAGVNFYVTGLEQSV